MTWKRQAPMQLEHSSYAIYRDVDSRRLRETSLVFVGSQPNWPFNAIMPGDLTMDSEFEHVGNEVVQARPEQYKRRGRDEGPGSAYRIYRVRVNGAMLGVVKEDSLRDLLVSIKGLDLYQDSYNLTHGQTIETDIRVHGKPLHVWVQVHVWKVLTGG